VLQAAKGRGMSHPLVSFQKQGKQLVSVVQGNVGNVAKNTAQVNTSGSFARMYVWNVAYMNVMVRIAVTLAGIVNTTML
jgi:hypothetical protein